MTVSPAVIRAEIPVTLEMVAAVEEYNCYFEAEPSVFFGIVRDIFRAMAAHAPVELVSEGERTALKERDAAIEERDEARKRLGNWRKRAFSAICANAELHTETIRLHDILAQRPAPNVPDPKKPNPYRDFTTDPRRMGL